MKLLKMMAVLCLGWFGLAQNSLAADRSGDTRYPIVLAHGLSGFTSVGGVDYFFGVETALNSVGARDVFAPQVTAFADSFVRGEELLASIETVLAITGADKVNIIGHSQGGIDARYVAGVRPDLVASVTSIGSPHFGSETADLVGRARGPARNLLAEIANGFGEVIALASGGSGQTQNSLGSLENLTTAGADRFNRAFPAGLREGRCRPARVFNARSGTFGRLFPRFVTDYSVNDGARRVNGVRFYSMGGVHNPLRNINALDASDVVLGLSSTTLPAGNDGVVARCSTHFGQVIRDDYVLNHLDQMNWLFGLRGIGTSDPLSVYKAHARRLRAAGL